MLRVQARDHSLYVVSRGRAYVRVPKDALDDLFGNT